MNKVWSWKRGEVRTFYILSSPLWNYRFEFFRMTIFRLPRASLLLIFRLTCLSTSVCWSSFSRHRKSIFRSRLSLCRSSCHVRPHSLAQTKLMGSVTTLVCRSADLAVWFRVLWCNVRHFLSVFVQKRRVSWYLGITVKDQDLCGHLSDGCLAPQNLSSEWYYKTLILPSL